MRLVYIDNLRIFLTILVILQHLIVAYGGGSGNWYYNDLDNLDSASWYAMTYIWLLNQAFFMSFLFMISSYFTPGSYNKKGAINYIKDRLVRLGIPLVIYIVIVNTILNYSAWIQADFSGSFIEFLGPYIYTYKKLDTGVMWFIEVLLFFSLVYAAWRLIGNDAILSKNASVKADFAEIKQLPFPDNRQITCFALTIAILVFLERCFLYSNPFLEALGIPKGHISSYTALLVLGVLTYQNNWLVKLPRRQGKFWIYITIGLMILMPFILIYAGILDGRFSPYDIRGEWGWSELLLFALWEQLTSIAIILALLFWFREKFASQSQWLKSLARDTYAVYLVHSPVLTLLVFAFRGIELNSLLKFILMAPLVTFACFLSGRILRLLPLARDIL